MAIQKFADEVMADGPIGYWRLGEAPGSVIAADASGNGNNGTCSGGIKFGERGFHGGDTAAQFDGATGRIIVNDNESLNPLYITMEAKVRWSGLHPDYRGVLQRILEKSSSFQAQAQYALIILPNGNPRVELRTTNNSWAALQSPNVIAQGVEAHVVATYDGNFIRLYVNGKLDSEIRESGTIAHPAAQTPPVVSGVGIGNQTQRDRPFNGLIDEVALYPTALSEERIRAHYQAQFPEIFQYAAKFICGKSAGEVVAPGVYFTAVNVHNPADTKISFRVKMAVAWPGLKPGPVSAFHEAELGPDEALEIDCPDIFKFVETKADFLKGFVVVESEVELDVVAVYTAAGRDGQVETLHTERVSPRSLKEGPVRSV